MTSQRVIGEIVGLNRSGGLQTHEDVSTVKEKKKKKKSVARNGVDSGGKENSTSNLAEKVSEGVESWMVESSDENDLEKQEAKKKKKKKRVAKNGADGGGKENLTSNLAEKVSEGFESWVVEPPSSDGNDLVNQKAKKKDKRSKKRVAKKDLDGKENLSSNVDEEAPQELCSCGENGFEKRETEKKKMKKRKKVDSDATAEEKPKKPKTKKPKLQNQIRPSSEDFISESKLTSPFSPGPHKQHHESLKPDISKPKKPEFGAGMAASAKDGSFEPSSSQSGRSSPAVSGSPQSVPSVSEKSGKGGPSKSKKPKFGVTPSYSAGPRSQSSNSCSPHPAAGKDTHGGKAASSKPKKFEVHGTKSAGQPLSDLAEELGEMMMQVERASSAVEKIQIPTVKAKKFVPVFSKTGQKM